MDDSALEVVPHDLAYADQVPSRQRIKSESLKPLVIVPFNVDQQKLQTPCITQSRTQRGQPIPLHGGCELVQVGCNGWDQFDLGGCAAFGLYQVAGPSHQVDNVPGTLKLHLALSHQRMAEPRCFQVHVHGQDVLALSGQGIGAVHQGHRASHATLEAVKGEDVRTRCHTLCHFHQSHACQAVLFLCLYRRLCCLYRTFGRAESQGLPLGTQGSIQRITKARGAFKLGAECP